jgi:hypothetical protein
MPSMPPFNVANTNFNLHRNRLHKISDIPDQRAFNDSMSGEMTQVRPGMTPEPS